MSACEIAFRTLDAAHLLLDGRRSWKFAAPLGIGNPNWPGLADGVARLDLITEWRAAYDDARNGRFTWFDTTWPPADPPDWHLDPSTGLHWPKAKFGPKIPYRHDRRHGDVKHVWELNRLQYLQPIAALARVTGESAPADLVRRHVADWIANNPPYSGIGWASGIEIGLRAISLAIVGTLMEFDPDLQVAVAQTLMAHGRWLARYPSRYSSANNHAIAEALGLLTIGVTMPRLPHAAAWAARGRKILERESLRQIYPDGVGCEQALGYQCFTLEMLALAENLGAHTASRFAQAGTFLRALTGPKGETAHFGDDDESRVFWSPRGPELHALAIQQAIGAAPVIAAPPQLRQSVLPNDKAPKPAEDGVAHFPDGGYTVVREGAMHLLFDHGPLGYASIAAHGHGDALSIWLQVDGDPVLIDAGTYRYYGARETRDAFRGTAAHNTLSIDGADQSEIAGPFNWSRKAVCKVVSLTRAPWSIEAEHDGFHARFGCRHRRRIENAGPLQFSVTDRVTGHIGPWPVAIGFLIAPDHIVRHKEGVWHIGKTVRLTYSGPLKEELLPAEFSPRMGVLRQASRLVFRGSMGKTDSSEFHFSLVR